jgi:hypothetical protein
MLQAVIEMSFRLQNMHAASDMPSQNKSIKDHSSVYYVLYKQHRRYCGIKQPVCPNLHEMRNKTVTPRACYTKILIR